MDLLTSTLAATQLPTTEFQYVILYNTFYIIRLMQYSQWILKICNHTRASKAQRYYSVRNLIDCYLLDLYELVTVSLSDESSELSSPSPLWALLSALRLVHCLNGFLTSKVRSFLITAEVSSSAAADKHTSPTLNHYIYNYIMFMQICTTNQ